MANEVMNVVPQEMEITRPGFESEKGFALLQRMAKMFSMYRPGDVSGREQFRKLRDCREHGTAHGG